MTVVPLHPKVRYYCSVCDEHYYEHERDNHRNCIQFSFCSGCGRAFAPGDDDCPMCGTKPPGEAA